MKYIIFERPDGLEHLVIFDELTNHIDMKNQINLPVLGAGKLYFNEFDPGCSLINGSVSLGISYSTKDSERDYKVISRVMSFRG
jgi:hypothetical protein